MEYNGFKLTRSWISPIHGKSQGMFICKFCNSEFEAKVINIKLGRKRSCGCKTSEGKAAGGRKNLKHGLMDHPVRRIWANIKRRCYNAKGRAYNQYQGRGITLYDPWIDDFQAFYDYVISLPSYSGKEALGRGGLTLDRINNNGNYEPRNLRWATAKEQALNRRTNV